MKKRKAARMLNDLSMVFFLISSTVVAFLPIADREKHPAIAVLAGGIFWVGLLWGIFLYILSCQKIKNLKAIKITARWSVSVYLHPDPPKKD